MHSQNENIPINNLHIGLQQQILSMQQQATEKKYSISKLCELQEQRIYQSLHKNRYSLLNEIKKVNPNLHKELRDIKPQELQSKLEHYQQLQRRSMTSTETSDYDSSVYQKDDDIGNYLEQSSKKKQYEDDYDYQKTYGDQCDMYLFFQ
ncbi:hypothetical protein pb186bvf_019560 [Paramecium bursaria]